MGIKNKKRELFIFIKCIVLFLFLGMDGYGVAQDGFRAMWRGAGLKLRSGRGGCEFKVPNRNPKNIKSL